MCGVAEIILARHDGTECEHLGVECGRSLVIVGRLLDVISLDLARGDVAGVDVYAPVVALIVDVVVVHEDERFDACRVVEHLIAVEPVFVGLDVALEHQSEHVGEEVHLRPYRLHGVIKSGVGILFEIDFAVDVTSPHHVFRHLGGCGVRDARPSGDVFGV